MPDGLILFIANDKVFCDCIHICTLGDKFNPELGVYATNLRYLTSIYIVFISLLESSYLVPEALIKTKTGQPSFPDQK